MKLAAALLGVVLLLTGCSGSDDPAPTPVDPSRSADRDQLEQQAQEQAEQQQDAQDQLADEVDQKAADATSAVTVDVVIADGTVTPQGDRVDVAVGQPVTLKVSSDVDEEIHVHSDPEHTYEVSAGDSITESFTVDTPGQVAVEAHGLDVTIVQLVVRP